jgi:SAM-dependent methyltransferase/uncharacterized protein YbaR (Trm112 family)
MDISLLSLLRCPFCSGNLNSSGIDLVTQTPGYDVLTCCCGRYPVVAGIPILKKGSGGIIDRVVSLIETGRHQEALLAMITPGSPILAPVWMQSLPRVKGIGWLKHLAHQRALDGWREQAIALLTDQGGQVPACTVFNFFFRPHWKYRRHNWEYRNYLYFRFGQPRYLVALSFASLIQQPNKPILDLACGYGHITRSLVHRAQGQPVIGVDNTFFGLYVAKHWIAPEAEFVCCTAEASLPFPDGAFSVAFCSDAFHYFANKAASIRELKRLTQQDGLIVLVWIHNVLFRLPYDGMPLPPEGYHWLVADIPHRLVADHDILARYRQKQGPSLARITDAERLAKAPLLSLIASHRQDVFQDHGPFEDWPHAEGWLGINPLYTAEQPDAVGNVRLRRTFPSAFYEEDHAECKDYLPERVTVPMSVWTNLIAGKRVPAMEGLIEQCVVLGMPPRYRCDK